MSKCDQPKKLEYPVQFSFTQQRHPQLQVVALAPVTNPTSSVRIKVTFLIVRFPFDLDPGDHTAKRMKSTDLAGRERYAPGD